MKKKWLVLVVFLLFFGQELVARTGAQSTLHRQLNPNSNIWVVCVDSEGDLKYQACYESDRLDMVDYKTIKLRIIFPPEDAYVGKLFIDDLTRKTNRFYILTGSPVPDENGRVRNTTRTESQIMNVFLSEQFRGVAEPKGSLDLVLTAKAIDGKSGVVKLNLKLKNAKQN